MARSGVGLPYKAGPAERAEQAARLGQNHTNYELIINCSSLAFSGLLWPPLPPAVESAL